MMARHAQAVAGTVVRWLRSLAASKEATATGCTTRKLQSTTGVQGTGRVACRGGNESSVARVAWAAASNVSVGSTSEVESNKDRPWECLHNRRVSSRYSDLRHGRNARQDRWAGAPSRGESKDLEDYKLGNVGRHWQGLRYH